MPRGAMAQPRSFVGGHLLATLVGLVALTAWRRLGGAPEIWAAAAVGGSLAVMMATRTIHSPAGANPLMVFAEQADWSFLLARVVPGLVVVFCVALLANNLRAPWGVPRWPRRMRFD
jgi:CBS-domain-containing membrane protein